MTRTASLIAVGVAACGGDVPQVEDRRPPPDAYECEMERPTACVERPAIALAPTPTSPGGPLYVAGAAGELFRLSGPAGELVADPIGYITHDSFHDLDRLLSCDIDGDGDLEITYSQIDSLDAGYVVWGEPGTAVPFGTTTAPERLQSARCVDFDGDGYDDLVGLLAADRIGVLRGDSTGLARAPLEIPVEPVDPEGDDPDWIWLVVTSTAADIDSDDRVEWIWTVLELAEIRIWSLDATASTSTETPGPTLGDVGVQRLDLADLDGDGSLDLVVLARAPSGDGRVIVSLGDGAGGFGSPIDLALADVPRRVTFADLDDDDDLEALVVGSWNDGVTLVDLVDGELEIAEAFPSYASDAVALRFDDDTQWDLAVLHADTWEVEMISNAFDLQ